MLIKLLKGVLTWYSRPQPKTILSSCKALIYYSFCKLKYKMLTNFIILLITVSRRCFITMLYNDRLNTNQISKIRSTCEMKYLRQLNGYTHNKFSLFKKQKSQNNFNKNVHKLHNQRKHGQQFLYIVTVPLHRYSTTIYCAYNH